MNEELVIEKVRELDPASRPDMNTMDDISTAKIFQHVFMRDVRYNVTAKSWYVYDGIRWKPDPSGLMVESCAKMLSRALWIYAADGVSSDFQRYVTKLTSRSQRWTMMKDVRDLLRVEQTDFDADPYLFNCKNCVLDLKEHRVIEHDPDLLLSKVANVDYEPAAKSTVFEEFMRQIMQGDMEKIEYLQTLFGYAMTGTNEREECFLLYGSTTRNGKGTLTNTMNCLFGDYGANIQPETLAMQKGRDGRRASGDIARLNGVRFLQMSEPPKNMKLDVALLKTLTGRDVMTARHLYEREFEFVPCFKLFINTNFLPVVTDDTLFSSGRVKVITFDRHFGEEEQDNTLKDRLQTPEVLSGILNWILTGLKRYHDNGNTIWTPDSVRATTDSYRAKSDKVRSFINECLLSDPSSAVMAKDVYTAFTQWCQSMGYGIETKSVFFDNLRTKGTLSATGTVAGKTYHNVVKGFRIDDSQFPQMPDDDPAECCV